MNAGAAKVTTAATSPGSYVQFTFTAQAGKPYHLWIRGRAEANAYTNDSVFVQFSNSVTSTGAPTLRIGTTSAAEYNLEDCNGCGLSGWGWQDNAWGNGVTGAKIYFASSGTQTLRIQSREDGLSIDQIILSPASTSFLNASPGAFKNDTKIYAATQASVARPEPAVTAAFQPPGFDTGERSGSGFRVPGSGFRFGVQGDLAVARFETSDGSLEGPVPSVVRHAAPHGQATQRRGSFWFTLPHGNRSS
jgi:hypothetical protein